MTDNNPICDCYSALDAESYSLKCYQI